MLRREDRPLLVALLVLALMFGANALISLADNPNQEPASGKHHDPYEIPKLILEALEAAATVGIAGYAVRQYRASRRSSERQLRAYVYFDGPKSRLWPPANPNRVSVYADIVNSGETWARNLVIQTAIVREADIADPFENAIGGWDKRAMVPIVMGPRQSKDVQLGDVFLSEFPEIHQGFVCVHFVARITYQDAVSDPSITHETHLSRRFIVDSEGGYAFTHNATHNCADEDCAP